ncbi:glycosyltransferase family 2 protein [Butyrivibrio sp. WCD3002]|uniref:glycosyltransferase family 2 protein n=1 Tax=Butyrivibrio sp. WCD3002 TaxID=1280676 RepID=UPI00040E7AEE|nr:glycosyltransferase family 2 protein [Butyrivibrio sp. WCD3002]
MNRKVSVLVPAFNEQDSLNELYSRILDNVKKLISNQLISEYEIVFVNDGSSDNTEAVMCELADKDPNVHVISFRKNFGKSPALDCGFKHVTGDIVFTMDADLQDDPDEFQRFIEKIDEGYDLVVGWKKNRLDSAEKRLPSKLFNAVTSKLSGVYLHDHDCGFKCFRKEVIDSLDLYGELHRYVPVLAHRKGFRITEITVLHHKREHGHSKYGMERYMRGLLDSMTTTFLLKYSDRPMYFFGRVGIGLTFVGFVICLFLTVLWFMGQAIGTRPLLTLGVLCIIAGFQFIATGFLGNLVVENTHRRTYDESHVKFIK